MPRKPKAGVAAEVTLTLRMTDNDRALLDRLVAMRAAELAELGADEIDVTAASYVRGLIRREAKAKGITAAPAGPGSALDAHPAPVPKDAATEPDAAAIRAALLAAIEKGEKQTHIADRAGIDRGSISKFAKGIRGLSAENLRKLAKAIA